MKKTFFCRHNFFVSKTQTMRIPEVEVLKSESHNLLEWDKIFKLPQDINFYENSCELINRIDYDCNYLIVIYESKTLLTLLGAHDAECDNPRNCSCCGKKRRCSIAFAGVATFECLCVVTDPFKLNGEILDMKLLKYYMNGRFRDSTDIDYPESRFVFCRPSVGNLNYSIFVGLNEVKLYQRYSNSRFSLSIHCIGLKWKFMRLLWIAYLKEDIEYCHIAKLPKDIIRYVIQIVNLDYTNEQNIRAHKRKRESTGDGPLMYTVF